MAWYKRGNPLRPLLLSLCPLRALFVTINIPDHRPKARFSSNSPCRRRIFRPPNNPDPSVKNRCETRDMVLLIHSPAKDIHSARVKETPAPFLTLSPNEFSGRYGNVLEDSRFFTRCLMNIFGKSKYIYCEGVLSENKICQCSPESNLRNENSRV